MKGNIKKVSGILLACVIAAVLTFPALGESKTKNPAAEARKGTVRILALCEDGCAALGSGFGVGEAGEETDIYVTNWHVAVEPCQHGLGVEYIYILLDDHAFNYMKVDTERMVRCIMLDTTTSAAGIPDFAILQSERKIPGRVALPLLSRSECYESEKIFALGFPGNGDYANGMQYIAAEVSEVTSTEGTISRMLDNFAGVPYEVIQHTAHINHGNSGGPLINENGAVIGINTYGFGDSMVDADEGSANASEYSISVSIDYVMKALDKLDISYDTYGTKKNVLFRLLPAAAVILFIMIAAAGVIMTKKKRMKAGSPMQTFAQGKSAQPPMRTPVQNPTQPPMRTPMQTPVQNPAQTSARPPLYSQASMAPGGHIQQQVRSSMNLRGTNGCFQGHTYAFSSDRCRFGTDSSCKLRYPPGTPGISPVHCELIIQNGRFYLTDCGSQFGTYVNGRKIVSGQPVLLGAGDTICLASAQEAFQVVGS